MQRKLSELLPEDLHNGKGEVEISVPDWAFKPDHWNVAFLRGLQKLAPEWASHRIWEVGVGTGVNLISLRGSASKATWYFSDYNPRCVELASNNLAAAGITGKHIALKGSTDLLRVPTGSPPRVDIVFGCLPQVPISMDLQKGDRVAHYYDPGKYPCSKRHACGLGLNETLLKQAKDVLPDNGRIVLNLSGRPGKPRLEAMFRENGYEPRIVHTMTVPQHQETSLETLAQQESHGEIAFEFFADPDGEAIPASAAERRRVRRERVFHKIYVIEGVRL
jgi:methylase of polypeptide subunit release factors